MNELELAPVGLPDQATLTKHLRARLEELVADERKARGEVHAPEDVYPAVLRLARVHEGLMGFSRAFATIAKESLGFVQDDLELAVGQQDGIPVSGLSVPDPDGTTVAVALDTPAPGYTFDLETLLISVEGETLAWLEDEGGPDEVSLVGLLRHALDLLLSLGKFEPHVTKVRAFADEVARVDPKASTAVRQAIKPKPAKFNGVKLKREQPKAGK